MSFIAVYDPKSPAKQDTLVLDALLSEEHSLDNKVTAFPREDGAAVNDHIINAPRKLTIQGMITDTPVWDPANVKIPKGTRVQNAFNELEKLYQSRKTVSVITRMKEYKDMAIERISIPRAPATGKAIEFTMSLVQILKADSKTVEFKPAGVRSEGAAPSVNAGKQPPKTLRGLGQKVKSNS